MAYKEIPDVWPDEKLEREMLLGAGFVVNNLDGVMKDAANDVVCHVKALLCRIRDLEQCVEAQQKELTARKSEMAQCNKMYEAAARLATEHEKTIKEMGGYR